MSFRGFYNSLATRPLDIGSNNVIPSDTPFIAEVDIVDVNHSIAITTVDPVTIDWGDGTSQIVSGGFDGKVTKTTPYSTAGKKIITITGSQWGTSYFEQGSYIVGGLSTVNSFTSDRNKITNIIQWGTNLWTSLRYVGFMYAPGGLYSATDVPNLSLGPSLAYAFSGLFSVSPSNNLFNGNISNWNISNVTDLNNMFRYNTAFNRPIGVWNTANVTNMANLFINATTFNSSIGAWNVSKVTNMSRMFASATAFNQNIGTWNTSNVTTLYETFAAATAFNQNIGTWDTSNVSNMYGTFSAAASFNCGQNSGIAQNSLNRTASGGWKTNNVTRMDLMFANCTAWNGDISEWCVTNITSSPTNFALNTTNWTSQFTKSPVWGTCPIP